jgi:hypothetical protein
MSILRRLIGGPGPAAPAAPPPSATEIADAERAYERELMRAEAERLSADLVQRQMRYADRSWTPPAQGGERRADDGDATT